MKRFLIILLSLSILTFSFSGIVIAEYSSSVTISNWNFENTVSPNGDLSGVGWNYRLYVNPEDSLTDGMLYYAMNNEGGNGTSSAGSNSLVMKCPGTSGGYNKTAILLESPNSPVTYSGDKEISFKYSFDYKCIAGSMNTAILFVNENGKIYNGSSWIDFNVTKDDDWKFFDSEGNPGYASIAKSSENSSWTSSSVNVNAPKETKFVKLAVIATGGGANKFAIDNLKVTYQEAEEKLPIPEKVTNLTSVSDDGRVLLSWNLPANTKYFAGVKIDIKYGNNIEKTEYIDDLATTSYTADGLTNGEEYTFEVSSYDSNREYFSEAAVTNCVPLEPGTFAKLKIKNQIGDISIYKDDYESAIDINILPVEGGAFTDEIKTLAESTNLFDVYGNEVEFTSENSNVSFRTVLYDISGTLKVRKQQLVYDPKGVQSESETISVSATSGIYKGTATFNITLNDPPETEIPANDPDSDTQYLYLPNASFERWQSGYEPTEFNKPLSGGWRTILWQHSTAHLGNDYLCYRATSGSKGKGLDIKIPSANSNGYMMIHSAYIPAPDNKSHEYTFGFDYKQNAERATGAIFFYNSDFELFSGNNEMGEPVWVSDPTGADLWTSYDANGLKSYGMLPQQTAFYSGKITRTAPEGTAYIGVAFLAVQNSAYRIYVDEAYLSYEKMPKVKPVVNLTSEAGDSEVTLKWNKSSGDNLYYGARVTVLDGKDIVKTVNTTLEKPEELTITGLTNNKKYTFEVCSFDKEKENYASAVTVTDIPHLAGVLPVRNSILPRTAYTDDYEVSVDLNIVPDGDLVTDAALLAYYNNSVDKINIFDSKGKLLNFSSDSDEISFRNVKYKFAVTSDGAKVQSVIKQQLVYKPTAAKVGSFEFKISADDGEGSSGESTASITVITPPVDEIPFNDSSLEYHFLYVPNAGFERPIYSSEYNTDLSGGWHPVLWGDASGCLGDNQLCYRYVATNDGNGLDLKAPSGGKSNLMLESAFIPTEDDIQREYIYSVTYKGGGVAKQNFAMFFFNSDKAVFNGYDGDGNPVWIDNPEGADLWNSVDANGKEAFIAVDNPSGYTLCELRRTAPEGTAYIKLALAATGSGAYRYQADNIKLSYLKNEAPEVICTSPIDDNVYLGDEYTLDLNECFRDPENDLMTFSADDERCEIKDGIFKYTANKLGRKTIVITAKDVNNAKTDIELNLDVEYNNNISIKNKDAKTADPTRISGNANALNSQGTQLTSLSQIKSDNILRVSINVQNTAADAAFATIVLVKYDSNGYVENIETKSIYIPSTVDDSPFNIQKDFVLKNKNGYVKIMVWNSALNPVSLISSMKI